MHHDDVFSHSGNEFTIRLSDSAGTIAWDQIEVIRAYKIDQLIIDRIVIEVATKENIYSV